MKLPHERFDYSAIVDRKPWKLPKGARIAVWTIVNIEEWDIEKPMAAPVPDGAAGRGDGARRPELGVARLRHARRASGGSTRRSRSGRSAATTSINANVCHVVSARRAGACATPAGSSWATP